MGTYYLHIRNAVYRVTLSYEFCGGGRKLQDKLKSLLPDQGPAEAVALVDTQLGGRSIAADTL